MQVAKRPYHGALGTRGRLGAAINLLVFYTRARVNRICFKPNSPAQLFTLKPMQCTAWHAGCRNTYMWGRGCWVKAVPVVHVQLGQDRTKSYTCCYTARQHVHHIIIVFS